jgi:hypothetical protein
MRSLYAATFDAVEFDWRSIAGPTQMTSQRGQADATFVSASGNVLARRWAMVRVVALPATIELQKHDDGCLLPV